MTASTVSFRRAGLAAGFAAAALAAAQGASAQTLVSYETFATTNLAPARWYGDDGRTYGGVRLEARRAIVEGQGRVELRAWGDNTSNSGLSSARNSLVAVSSPSITAMRSTITMRTATLSACSANATQPTVVRARMFGFYFNAGIAAAGSNFNDVFAGAQVQRASNSTDPANTFRISGFAGICADDSCIASNSLGSVDLGTVTLNTPVTLELRWDAANNRFTFKRDAQATVNLAYTVPDGQGASFPAKRIEVSNIVPRCLTTPRPTAFASADFDNIFTNALTAQANARWIVPLDRADEAAIDPLAGPLN